MRTKTFTFLSGLKLLGFAFGLFLWCGSAFSSANETPVNLVSNPGFESGLTGWGSWGGTQTINTTNVHGGTKSMQFTGEGGLSQTLTTGFVAGSTYTLSAWCVIPDGATASAYIGLQSVDGANVKTTQTSSVITNSSSFEKHEVTFTVPVGTVTLAAFVYQEGGTTTIIADDFSLMLVPENLLTNPGFEEASGGYGLWERSAVQSDIFHDGTKAAVVWNMGVPDPGYTGGGLGYEYLAPVVGGTYKLSAYGKLKNDIGNDANIFIQFKDASGAKLGIEQASTFAGKDWAMQSVEAVIPENTAKLVCGIWFDGSGSDSLYMDDFTLVLVSAPEVPTVGTGTFYKPSYINVTGGGEMPDIANGLTCDCDGMGVTDATACLQAALNEAKAQGKPLLIPYTDKFYKISDQLIVDCSVIGVGGMPVIKQTNDKMPNLLVVDDMTGWIYNLHLIGTYDGTPKPLISYEFGHNIAVRGVNGLTISNNILETPQGDNIGDEGGAQNTVRNLLITNNTLKDAWRCGISAAGIVDRMAIMNNVIYWYSQYVDPIDLEPYQDASKVTNIEVGYNHIESPNPVWTDETHFYEAVLQITAYFDPTPGGNVFSYKNFGNWVAPFSKVTGYLNGPSAWTTILNINNAVGEKIPGTDSQAPVAPKDLAAASVTKTSFDLTWTASTDNTGVVGYLVYKNDSVIGIATASPYKITGLKCGNAYQMAVKAYDADGNISEAGQANIATLDCGGGVNLLLNPGFEAGLTSWDVWGGSALESTTVRSGVNSLKVGPDDGGRAQNFTGFTTGSTYVLSAYGMLTGTGDFYKQSAYIGAQFKDAAGAKIDTQTAAITDSINWKQTALTFTVPANAASVTVFTYFEARGITTNSVITDDWSLVAFTPVTGVTVDPAKVTLAEGIVKQLKAVIVPESASNRELIWSSSDTTIVSVSSTGMVQAMKLGTAIVTATTVDGSKTSSCEVTVKVPGGNMLQNPGIEKALSVGWTGDWGNNKVLATSKHSGKYSLAIGPNDGGRAQPLLGFVPGSTYTLSAWCMLNGTGFSSQRTYVGALIKDAAGKRLSNPTVIITDSIAWHQYSVTFTIPLEAASVDIFAYLEAGTIKTTFTLTDNWALISGWTSLPYIPTSISSNKMDNFKLYPNPLIGQSLTIEGVEGAKSISIYDMTGRLVMNQSLQKSNNQSVILNEKLMKGSYIVKIATSGESLSKLLIVQ